MSPREDTLPDAAAAPGGTRVLGRSLALLFELGEEEAPLPLSELAERTGLPASTAYRLADELEWHGLVERDSAGLALGLRLLELARRIEDRLAPALLEPARGVMRVLAREHDETVLLTAPAGRFAIGLDSVEPPRPVRLSLGRWRVAPMHLGASGKVLLAFLPERAAERVLASAVDLDAKRLRAELARVRDAGVAVTHGELDEGVSGVAAPVLGAGGRPLAGLALAGPSERIEPRVEALSEAVRRAAREVEAALPAREGRAPLTGRVSS